MATKKFGVDFPSATTPLAGDETLSIMQGGTLKDATTLDIAALAGASLPDDSVTNAKLAEVSTQTIKGRMTAGTGNPEDLTAAQAAAVVQGTGLDADAAGMRGIPFNDQTGNYTLVAADSGKCIRHTSGAGAGDTFTIPANSTVAFEQGTAVSFANLDSNSVSIAAAGGVTLRFIPTGSTGTRTLAQYGYVTAVKMAADEWWISGPGLS